MKATFFTSNVATLGTFNLSVLTMQTMVEKLTNLFWDKVLSETATPWMFVEVEKLPGVTEVFVRIPNQHKRDTGSRYFYKVSSTDEAVALVKKVSAFEGATQRNARALLLWLADKQQIRTIMAPEYLRSLVSYFLGLTGGEGSFLSEDIWDTLRKEAGLMS